MKFAKQSIVALLICVSLVFASSAFAQTGDDYNTPDSWSKHQTVSGTKFTMDGMSVGTGTLKLGLTSRYTGRFSDFSDQMFYQYLRGYLSDFELGNGTMRVALNLRAAKDLDGVVTEEEWKYHFAPTVMDSQADYDSNYWDFRLYDANVVLDNVINYTKFTAGRFRIDYLTESKIDGAEVFFGNENYSGYIYYGLPVSYYEHLNSQVVGGGANAHLFNDLIIIRGEVAQYMGGDDNDSWPTGVDTLVWKLRADANLAFDNIAVLNPYGEIGMVQDAVLLEAGMFGNIVPTGTSFNIWVGGQVDNNTDPVNPVVSDYVYLKDTDTEYTQFGLNLYQGLAQYFVVGAGFETRVNTKESYANRDYIRIMGNIDFFGMIPNNYISLTVDYYDVQSYKAQDAEQKLFFGGRVTQNVTPAIAAWLGANMMSLKYNAHPINLHYLGSATTQPAGFVDEKEDNNVYTVYVGGQWQINDMFSILGDYTYEMSDVIGAVDSDNENIHYAELWLNVAF